MPDIFCKAGISSQWPSFVLDLKSLPCSDKVKVWVEVLCAGLPRPPCSYSVEVSGSNRPERRQQAVGCAAMGQLWFQGLGLS